jgi:hypothetical protein
MQRFRFPIAVALTSLALVVAIFAIGGVLVRNAIASSPIGGAFWAAGMPWHDGVGGPPWARGDRGWHAGALPPELAGLADVPAGERFSHFQGVRVQLTDKVNRPVTVEVTPGTATAASATSLTITANDGSTKTFTLDDRTILRGKETPAANDKVVVVTLNSGANAHAVISLSEGAGPWGAHRGWRG